MSSLRTSIQNFGLQASGIVAAFVLFVGMAVFPAPGAAEVATTTMDTEVGTLALEYSRLAHDAITTGNDLKLLVDGPEFYPVRQKLILHASRTIDISTFLWCDDEAGLHLAQLLVKKARQGVRVRVIISYYNLPKHEKVYWMLRQGGIQLVEHNPLYWGLSKAFEHSAHEKIMVVDGEVALMGGANLCNEYMIGGVRRLWHDLEVRVQGPQVARIQAQYDENWNWMATLDSQARFKASKRLSDPALIPVYKPVARYYPEKTRSAPEVSGDDDSLLVYAKSYRKQQAGEDALKLHVLLIETAVRRIRIMTPYLVPPEEMMDALQRAAARGVKIDILTNSPKVNDAWPARYAAISYSERLLQAGVRIYEYSLRTLHGKGMLIDDRLLSIGSHNFTNRSFRYNGESNLLTSSKGVISRFVQVFDSDMASSGPLLEGEAQKRIESWKDSGMALISEFLEEQI